MHLRVCSTYSLVFPLLSGFLVHCPPLAAEMKTNQASSAPSVKTFEAPAVVNLRPPPIERHKSFDEDDIAAKPIVPPKKVNTAKINARQYSIADLQMATDSFSVDNLIGEGSFGRVYRAQFDDGKVCFLPYD